MRIAGFVPFIQVADCGRSVDWYARLGFGVRGSLEHEGELCWVRLEAPGGAGLMLSRAEAPLDPRARDVTFYVYVDDVDAAHAELRAGGVAVGPIEKPEHSPRGEFRLVDPDGYCVFVTHT